MLVPQPHLMAQKINHHGAVSHPNLLGEENSAHAPCAQAADKAKAAGQPGGKLRFGLRGWGAKASPVSWTEGKIVRVSLLASGAGLHERW